MKKMIYKWFVPFLLTSLVLVSCNKYLDVQPKGVQLLKTVTDYDKWLNSDNVEFLISSKLNTLADNVDNPTITGELLYSNDRVYTWQSQFSEDVKGSAPIWSNYYQAIYYFNAVLKGIDDATGGTIQQKKSLKAEALLGRAFEYLTLVNLYGKVYNSTTAAQDLAVPLVTSVDITDPIPARSTVQQVYDQIISDINLAIPDLPKNNNQNRFRGSLAAAYGVLARTYLYMGDYPKAVQNAQLALGNGPNTIVDYTKLASNVDIPALIKRPDAIYARLSDLFTQLETPTLSFLKTFDKTDLRLKFFYTNLGDYSFETRGKTRYRPYGISYGSSYPNWGISVAEMRLVIAEGAVRANDLTTALNQLDLVRKCRLSTYQSYQSTDQNSVLQKVLEERKLEFSYCGLRWFDMRRLDAQGQMTTVNRYDGTGALIATLSPGSTKYTLQIPIQVLYFNPDWPQNPK